MGNVPIHVSPPPTGRIRRGKALPFLAMWGFVVLCAGGIGSVYEGISALETAALMARLEVRYGANWQDLPVAAGGVNPLWLAIETFFCIMWLGVSCLGGILYRYARLSL